MLDRPESGDRALLVFPDLARHVLDAPRKDEFIELATSSGVEVASTVIARCLQPHPGYLLRKGKLDEIQEAIHALAINIILIDHSLSPIQERNLEKLFQCRVIDRTTLILDIFAQRAASYEGKLQVELAQLNHLSTRLIRGWTHLERQKGGIGLRGPGETQLETDRRLIAKRIQSLEASLERVAKQRQQSRKKRKKSDANAFVVALVGYTNAGKSTLFNRLAKSDVYAADKLFATLDPTMRHLGKYGGKTILLADTVGFVSNLPHTLIAAFKSTLRETQEADLILHVVDAASSQFDWQMQEVDSVLKEIDADQVPKLLVFNKIDAVDVRDLQTRNDHKSVWISALTGQGLEMLQTKIVEQITNNNSIYSVKLPFDNGKLRAKLFELGAVVEEKIVANNYYDLCISLSHRDAQLLSGDNVKIEKIVSH